MTTKAWHSLIGCGAINCSSKFSSDASDNIYCIKAIMRPAYATHHRVRSIIINYLDGHDDSDNDDCGGGGGDGGGNDDDDDDDATLSDTKSDENIQTKTHLLSMNPH